MTLFLMAGWLVALGLGFGWWIDRRGLNGVISDLKDAKNTTAGAVQTVQDAAKKL